MKNSEAYGNKKYNLAGKIADLGIRTPGLPFGTHHSLHIWHPQPTVIAKFTAVLQICK